MAGVSSYSPPRDRRLWSRNRLAFSTTASHRFSQGLPFKISRNLFDSSVASVCFSAAIDDEIHEIGKLSPVGEDRPPPLNDEFAAALAFEIVREYKKVAMMKPDLEDKCLRFAATLSDEEDIKASDPRIPLQFVSVPMARNTSFSFRIQNFEQRLAIEYKALSPTALSQCFCC